MLCRLNHFNLVPLFDAFYRDGSLCLALGYKDGGSLEHLLLAHKALRVQEHNAVSGIPECALCEIVLQITLGLEHLNSRRLLCLGLLHWVLNPHRSSGLKRIHLSHRRNRATHAK